MTGYLSFMPCHAREFKKNIENEAHGWAPVYAHQTGYMVDGKVGSNSRMSATDIVPMDEPKPFPVKGWLYRGRSFRAEGLKNVSLWNIVHSVLQKDTVVSYWCARSKKVSKIRPV